MRLMLIKSKLSKEAKTRIIAGCISLICLALFILFGKYFSQKILLLLTFIVVLSGFIPSINEARHKYNKASAVEKKRVKKSLITTIIFSGVIFSLIILTLANKRLSFQLRAGFFIGMLFVIILYLGYNLFVEYKYSRPKARELELAARKKAERLCKELLKDRNK